MSLFDLLQFLALSVREINSHLPVRLGDDLMHVPASIAPNVSQLRGGFIDNRRYFGDLFWRQVKLGTEPFFHSGADPFGTMKVKEKMPGIHSPKKRASDSPSNEHEDESGNQFPLQRAVHFKTSS
jgi:hypothetical protein